QLVFPLARPSDVLLFEQSLTSDLSNPVSIGQLLVEWSVPAGRTVEMENQIAARAGSPVDVVGGLVLRLQLPVMQREAKRAEEHLEAILKTLETSKLSTLFGLALHGVAATLGDEHLRARAVPLLEKIVNTPTPLGRSIRFESPRSHSPATLLIREHLRAGA